MGLLSLLFGFSKENDIIDALNNNALLIDVRSETEYRSDNIKGTVNIPLGSLQNSIKKIKKQNKPVIVFCASGSRSTSAKNILKREGMENVLNAGGIHSLKSVMQKA